LANSSQDHVYARPLHRNKAPPPPVYDVTDEDLFNWPRIRRYVLFSLGSVRRRARLFAAVAGGMMVLAAVALKVLPKTYLVEARLLAQQNPALAVKADASQRTDPTRAAAETILRYENLNDLIRETDLVHEWRRHRAPILRLKDAILAQIAPQSPEDLAKPLAGLLQNNLSVWTTQDGTVVIHLTWPDDPIMAYRLVDAAQQNFLEKRHVIEVEAIAEQIAILERHAASLKKEVDAQVEQLQAKQTQANHERNSRRETRTARPPAPAAETADGANLRVMLDARRRALADLEDYRRRHLLELQTRLSEQRAIYSEHHPAIIDLEQSIESLKRDSPQLIALRAEEADLRQQLAHLSGGVEEPAVGAATSALNIPSDLFLDREDSAAEYERTQLRFSVQQYAHIRERIDAGRIELDTARAAFKYRYLIVAPPQVPRGPTKPNAMMVMIAAFLAGLALALFTTTAADLRSGALLETWQLQDLLGPSRGIIELRLP
jgi:hypothetical protein